MTTKRNAPKGTGLLPELAGPNRPARAPQAKRKPSTAERDALLDAAVKAGKFSESRRAFYAACWDADPAGTERAIGQLAAYKPPTSGAGERTGLLPELG